MNNNKELYNIIELLPLAIAMIDKNYEVIYVNNALTEMIGYTKEIFDSEMNWLRKLYPESGRAELMKNLWIKDLERLFRVDANVERNVTMKKKDGSIADIAINMVRFNENIVLMKFRDITEEMRKEKALKESEDKFRILAESASVGIMMYQEKKWIYANNAAEKISEYSESELKEMYFWDFIHPDMIDEIVKMEKIKQDEKELIGDYEIKILTKKGETKWIDLQADRTIYNNNTAVIVSFTDISERKRLQYELIQSQKMESLGHLVGGIAHDFNNILTPIMINTEVMLYSTDKDDIKHKQLKEIMYASNIAKDLIAKLLAFGRKQIMEFKFIDLNETISNLMQIIKSTIAKNIEVNLNVSCHDPIINADITQIEQIIMNLILNANDAMPNGGTLNIETNFIEIDENYSSIYSEIIPGNYIMLTVSDTGVGMGEEIQKHIFEPFYTTKGQGKGTGLGLSTVYGILKQHNAYIRFYSEINRGTTFKLYFPAVKKDKIFPKKIIKEINPEKYNILIVDDSEQIKDIAVKILKKAGFNTMSATHPKHAIDLSLKSNRKIDLLLTDVIMPDMNGAELVIEMLKFIPDLKYIYMSGYTEDVISHHGVLQKDTNFLQKPFSANKLLEKIENVLIKEKQHTD